MHNKLLNLEAPKNSAPFILSFKYVRFQYKADGHKANQATTLLSGNRADHLPLGF